MNGDLYKEMDPTKQRFTHSMNVTTAIAPLSPTSRIPVAQMIADLLCYPNRHYPCLRYLINSHALLPVMIQ